MNRNSQIDNYIDQFPSEVQEILNKIRKMMGEMVPNGVEAMTYGIPTIKLNGKNLIHFAAFKNHIGLYPTSSGVEAFKDKLKDYKTSKGAIQFPFDKPIPYDLIQKIIKYRLT